MAQENVGSASMLDSVKEENKAAKQIMPLDLSKRSSKRYVCTIEKCMNVFKTKQELLRHKRAHFGIAPYYCKAPNCPYRSTQGCDVYKHVLRVHFHQASKQIMPLD